MAILSGDIKLVASQVMDDVPEGGGAPTQSVIADAVSNAIFPDISELDRAGGRVNLRKVFASIQTIDTDKYFGGNVIVALPPQDPRVSVTLFTTNDVFDKRDAAKSRVEAYLAPGAEWPAFLYENHITGQRSIQLFQRTTVELPAVGKTLMLLYNEGLSTERRQYIRFTRVTAVQRTFTIPGSSIDYQALLVTCELSDPLRYDFPGSPATRDFIKLTGKTSTKDTVVADAATYAGVVPLVEDVSIGDIKATASSIFTQLVPNAQTETPIIDANAAGIYDKLVDASNGFVTIVSSQPFNANTSLYLGNAVFPGTLSIAVTGATLTDSKGQVFSGTQAVGTIDYARGTILWASTTPSYTGSKTVTFKAAGVPVEVADTAGIKITLENRSYNYVQTIDPPPAPGSLRVSFRAQGRYYDLTDNGGGELRGTDVSYGSGTISYTTGTFSVTLGALPDVNSTLLLSWGSKANYINRATVGVVPPRVQLQLSHPGVAPSSVTVTWNDGTARTATDDGKGNFTGAATGTISYQTGLVSLQPTALPAGGTTYTVAYQYGPADAETFVAPARSMGGNITLALAKSSITPGTVEMKWNVNIENYDSVSLVPAELQFRASVDPYVTVRDDGLGALKDAAGVSHGTINYSTGSITFNPDVTLSIPVPRYSVRQIGFTGNPSQPVYRNTFIGFEYKPAGAVFPIDLTGVVNVNYRAASSNTTVSDAFSTASLRFDLTNQFAENIVPGSICFTLGGNRYFDRSGRLYYNLDVLTGSATLAGSIDYTTGITTVDAWSPAATNAVAVQSLLTSIDGRPVDEVVFRTPVAPLRPGSLQVLATRLSGANVNVTAGLDGVITGTNVFGNVDYETGVVRLRFGALVTAAGNEGQIWYDPNAVGIDGKILKPAPVFSSTIRFNAVAVTYLPLDASILGLDPVRLPQDGRVPIFRPGAFAVIGNTQTVGPVGVSNGQVVDCGRERLSRVRVIGNDGLIISGGYTADLEAGTVTFTAVAGYSQPVKVEHRIEDMMLISDVQINGEMAFTRQISHNYPAGSSYISSALVAGDLKARVSLLFDQASWDGMTYSDTLVGSASTATYNDVLAPIEVTNKGASTERWVLRFTSSTAFQIIGEHVGVIGVGNINTDTAPINPATSEPYFTIRVAGWGIGWAIGNIVRLNTIGALFPVWAVRTVQQGPETVIDDSFTLLIRGDVDRP